MTPPPEPGPSASARPARPRRRFGLGAKLALGLAAALFAFGLMEIAARLHLKYVIGEDHALASRTTAVSESPWTEYDPNLGWRNKPKAHLPNLFPTGGVRINSQGIRADRDYEAEPPPGKVRVLAIGDSFTFGYDAGDSKTWPAQLEAMDPRLEVINLGACAYGLDQIVLSYEEAARRFKHHAVVLGFFNWDVNRATNDFTATGYSRPLMKVRNGEIEITNVPVPPPNPEGAPVYRRRLMLARYFNDFLLRREVTRFKFSPERSRSWELGALLFKRLKAAADANGAKVFAVDIPMYESLHESNAIPYRKQGAKLFAEAGIPYLDLHAQFQERWREGDRLYAHRDGGHCSPEGYRLIAAAALKLLTEGGWLKPPTAERTGSPPVGGPGGG